MASLRPHVRQRDPPEARPEHAILQWRWHLDEVYVRINGEMRYLWRAVDHEGEVLESYVTEERDKAAALKFIKKALIFVTKKGFGVPPEHPAFADFAWRPTHLYNDRIVSLLPWVANVIGTTMEACTRLIGTLAAIVNFPPEVAPGYRVFVRDAVNVEFAALICVLNGQTTWWSDEPI